MRILRGLAEVPQACRGATLAIGNFDGVHRGHQAVLGTAIADARRRASPAGVMVFDPHPRQYFRPDTPHFRLTPLPRELDLMALLGLDFAAVMTFDAALAGTSPAEFIERMLVARLGVGHVVVGHDFFFGRQRQGSPDLMREAGRRHGFGVTVVAPEGSSGEVFSSTHVREYLAEGHVKDAAEVLGHWWRVRGTVVGGAHRGTWLGFPTANIHLAPGVQLRHGIYAVRVYVDRVRFGGAAYLGTRPTYDDGPPVLEVFLFDFHENLYGREIEIEFIAFLRRDAKFANSDALKAQMEKDCAAAAREVAKVDAEDPMRAYPLGRALAERA